jgi:hypothetical protein
MDNVRGKRLAWAKFSALRNNLPGTWDENAVSDFHEGLTALEQAFGEDLSAFRISEERMQPVPMNIQRQPPSGHPVPRPPLAKSRYCSGQFARQQVEGVHSYLERLISPMSRSLDPQPVALTEAQRIRLVNAEKELRDAVQSRQQMKDLNHPPGWARAGFDNEPSPVVEIVGILNLELDVKKYVVEEINVLAEAAWEIRPLERFAELVKNCAAEAVDRGLGMVDPSDRPRVK